MSTKYNSVEELLRDPPLEEGARLADEVAAAVEEFRLADTLAQVRIEAGFTQGELAQKLGKSQSWVSKIENTSSADIKLSSFASYLEGCGHEVELCFTPKDLPGSSRVKMYATAMGRELEHLSKLGENDEQLAETIRKFNTDVIFNLGLIVQKSMGKLAPVFEPEAHERVYHVRDAKIHVAKISPGEKKQTQHQEVG